MRSQVHPIERESYRILEGRFDLSARPPLEKAVIARVLHATADPDLAESMVLDEESLTRAVESLRRDVPVIVDVQMVASGLSGSALCYLERVEENAAPTRSAAAMRIAALEHSEGALFVIGCAPSALSELVTLTGEGLVQPGFVIGTPVGFVGAADAKAALRSTGVASVTNVGDKGGSAVAAAAFNALARVAKGEGDGAP